MFQEPDIADIPNDRPDTQLGIQIFEFYRKKINQVFVMIKKQDLFGRKRRDLPADLGTDGAPRAESVFLAVRLRSAVETVPFDYSLETFALGNAAYRHFVANGKSFN